MMSVKNHQTPPTIRPERDLNMNKIMHSFLSLTNIEKEIPSIHYVCLKKNNGSIVLFSGSQLKNDSSISVEFDVFYAISYI